MLNAIGPKRRLVWLRRDLRLEDQHALAQAAADCLPCEVVQPLFIFDTNILDGLPANDARVGFIHAQVAGLKASLQSLGSDLWVRVGDPATFFQQFFSTDEVAGVYVSSDYEPRAIQRDQKVAAICKKQGVDFVSVKDQVIFEKSEILTSSGTCYTVFGPYKKKWLKELRPEHLEAFPEVGPAKWSEVKSYEVMPTLESFGFLQNNEIEIPRAELLPDLIKAYAESRDFPSANGTTRLGLHLRFGTVSVRAVVKAAQQLSETWLSELIWREFFMQILFHFPYVEKRSFRPEYDKLEWRKSPADMNKWQEGRTGYALVDAGMRELRQTGFMHNRVRMVTASFLTKHLFISWREGERYFAEKLLDYELASNNGNWQWVAGTGCDAAPYFRVFNPHIQLKKFDPKLEYVKKWVPEYGTSEYPEPMIAHAEGRDRALRGYLKALKGK